QRLGEMPGVEELPLDEDRAEFLQIASLLAQRLLELRLAQPPRLHQDRSEPILEPPDGRVGRHHLPLDERDGGGLLAALEGENAALLLDADQLEDVGEAEVLERSLERHRSDLVPALLAGEV